MSCGADVQRACGCARADQPSLYLRGSPDILVHTCVLEVMFLCDCELTQSLVRGFWSREELCN